MPFSTGETLLTQQVREQAKALGWPADVADLLDAHLFDGGVVTVEYPPESERRVMDLEFGTQHEVPRPAIRRFLNRVELGEWYLQSVLNDAGVL